MLRFARIEQPLLQQHLDSSTEIITQLGPALQKHLSWLEEPELELQKAQLGKQRQALATVGIGQQPEQREMMLVIERRLKRQAFADVLDRTPMKRAADGPAWIFAWEQILTDTIDDPIAVSHLQLMSQPEFYRNKSIELNGTIRGVQRISTSSNELGVENYFAVWMQPNEAGTGPFCFYVFELPDDFPAVGDQFLTMEVPATIVGVFFKLRVYAARSGAVPTCPLLLAKTIRIEQPDMAAVSSEWQAEPWVMIPFFLITIPLVSYLAYLVYQGTKTRLPNHGRVATEQIEKTFEDLKQDPDVKSEMERIRELRANDD